MSYSQALEEQIRILDRLRKSEWTHLEDWKAAAQVVIRMLELADPYYWSGPLCGIIREASRVLPDSWRWRPENLPTPSGFIWFAQPWDWGILNPDGDQTTIAAIGWSLVQEISDPESLGLSVTPFIYDNHSSHIIIRPAMVLRVRQGESIRDHVLDTKNNTGRRDADIDNSSLSIIGACFSFLDQRIMLAPQQRADRHTRKRLAREGFTHEPLVRVVELRRKQARSEYHGDSEPVEWSHQWIVSGHWRQQWYPSLNANQPRWIMPYIKGPEDKPLKAPAERVFAVVR